MYPDLFYGFMSSELEDTLTFQHPYTVLFLLHRPKTTFVQKQQIQKLLLVNFTDRAKTWCNSNRDSCPTHKSNKNRSCKMFLKTFDIQGGRQYSIYIPSRNASLLIRDWTSHRQMIKSCQSKTKFLIQLRCLRNFMSPWLYILFHLTDLCTIQPNNLPV